jgi:hypothetical protein
MRPAKSPAAGKVMAEFVRAKTMFTEAEYIALMECAVKLQTSTAAILRNAALEFVRNTWHEGH